MCVYNSPCTHRVSLEPGVIVTEFNDDLCKQKIYYLKSRKSRYERSKLASLDAPIQFTNAAVCVNRCDLSLSLSTVVSRLLRSIRTMTVGFYVSTKRVESSKNKTAALPG